MFTVQFHSLAWYSGLARTELSQQTGEKTRDAVLLAKVTVDTGQANYRITVGIRTEVVNNDRGENRLSRTRDPWAEERLSGCMAPSLILGRVEQP